MAFTYRGIILTVLWLVATSVMADFILRRDMNLEPTPKPLKPSAGTPQQQRHYAALKLYAQGRALDRQSRFVEALEAYQDALKQEPDIAEVYEALIPLCFQLDRPRQALDYCKKALELRPGNYLLWYRYGQELRDAGQRPEARDALSRAIKARELKEKLPLYVQVLFALAAVQEELKEYGPAAVSYAELVDLLAEPEKINPELTEQARKQIAEEVAKTYERLGELYLLAGKPEQAIATYKKAQERLPQRSARLHYQMAEVFLTQKKWEKACESLERFILSQPSGMEGYEKLIRVYGELGRKKEILPMLEMALQRDQFNIGLKLLLARECDRAGDSPRAEKTLLEVWQRTGSDDAFQQLALHYARQGRWAELLREIDNNFGDPQRALTARKQLDIVNREQTLVKGLAAEAAQALAQRQKLAYNTRRIFATLARQAKLYDVAEQLCRSCLTDDPQPGEAYIEMVRILNEGQCYPKLIALCREAAAKDNLRVPASVFRLEMIRALSMNGQTKEAVAAALESIKDATPGTADYFQARYTLILSYYRGGRFKEAEQEAKAMLKELSDAKQIRQVRYLLSGVYSTQQKWKESEELLQMILAADPDDATACNDLGYHWADQGKNLEEAERLIRKALEIDRMEKNRRRPPLEKATQEPDNAAYVDSLGWVLFRRGKLKEACEVLEKAVTLEADDPTVWSHLGDVYQALGQSERAHAVWQRAMQLYEQRKFVGPEDRRAEVKEKLKRLEVIRAGAVEKP